MPFRPADATCRWWIAMLVGCGWSASLGLSLAAAETPARRTSARAPARPATVVKPAVGQDESSGKTLSSKDARLRTLSQGTSSKDALARCIKRLPYQKFSREHRQQVDEILDEISLFRQLPAYELDVHHDVYRYFTDHPDVAVSVWRVMKISELHMYQTGRDSYEADAGDGTVGTIDVLYRSPTQNVILCEGTYKTPFLPKPITAKAIIHLQSEFREGETGQQAVRHRVSLFVSLPSETVEAAATLISPLSNIMIDRNFHDISVFIHMMSMAMKHQPGWVELTARQMEGVLKIRRAELVDVTAKVYADWLHERQIEVLSGEGDESRVDSADRDRRGQPSPASRQ